MTPETSAIDLADRLRPTVPGAGHPDIASAVLNQVLASARRFTDDVRAIGNQHFDQAPASSAHVLDLTAAVSRAVLDWIERWPA